ncbi:pentatricopeptide repeat-containing protein At4g13650-like isoform X2 [Aristolochia californica]|uniref:pentatricopeptide repeat-containing protein At4g13650-like isoform X2 n=1 Tax=Aristolochia californica TaxID=171875 RepID=UPI0035DDD8D6
MKEKPFTPKSSNVVSSLKPYCNPGSAFSLVPELQGAALSPNNFVFSSLIVTCSKLLSVDRGKQIHAQVIVSGFENDPFVKTSLVDMYSKFNDLESATSIFGQCTVSDPVMYNSMISGLVSFGYFQEAVNLFLEARRDFDLRPSEFTFGSLIKASANLEIEVGEQVHVFSIKTGLDFDCFVGTSLVDMYGRFGDMESSEKVFRNIFSVDIALYNAIIVGFSQNVLDEKALQFYQELRLRGLFPNDITFSSILRGCSSLKHVKLGRVLHGIIQKSEFQRDLAVNTALIDMYMKCGCVEESWKVFRHMPERNTISYNSMICGLGQNENFSEAVKLFIDMNRLNLEPDHATFVVLMNSCLGHERISYVHAIKHGFGSDSMVQNSLLDGLVKAGFVNEAQELFNKMQERTVISWTTLISGLSLLGFDSDALELFKRMQLAAINPNCFTISCVLKACGNLANLDQGICIHACSIKHGTNDDEFTNSSLLDMYANCGALGDSNKLFEELTKKDIVSWNSMITGFAQHGNGAEALKLLGDMEKYGIRPNHVTFISLLTACSRSGLVDEGVHIFESMTRKYGIVPCMEHYACLVDMYGRVGMLDRVRRSIESMPFEPDVSIWKIVLAACKLHGDADLAKIAGDHVLGSEYEDKASFVTLYNVLSVTHKWDEAEETRKRMRDQGLRKDPGVSWVQIKS